MLNSKDVEAEGEDTSVRQVRPPGGAFVRLNRFEAVVEGKLSEGFPCYRPAAALVGFKRRTPRGLTVLARP